MFLKDLVNLLGAELCEYKMLFYSWTSETFRTLNLFFKKRETENVIEGKVGHLQSQDFNVIREREEIVKRRIFPVTEGSGETRLSKKGKEKPCCSVARTKIQVISIWSVFMWIHFPLPAF